MSDFAVAGSGTIVKKKKAALMNTIMQLRKACNHPYLFDGAEPGPPFTNGAHLYENSGKMVLLHKLLIKLKSGNNRVLIFSQMTRMLDIISDYCYVQGYETCRIDGSMSAADRENEIVEYSKRDSNKFIFLLSTRSGGLGLNLAMADTVILYDSDWNPHSDKQAIDRAHRIGQKGVVHVYRFVSEHTVDEQITMRAEKKLYLDAMVMARGSMRKADGSTSQEDLLEVVTFGADRVFKSDSNTITDDDIDVIIGRGTYKTQQASQKLKDECQYDLKSFSMNAPQTEAMPTAGWLSSTAEQKAARPVRVADVHTPRVASLGEGLAVIPPHTTISSDAGPAIVRGRKEAGDFCYIWGLIGFGDEAGKPVAQAGLKLYYPVELPLARDVRVAQIALGPRHGAFVTPSGDLYLFGNGQKCTLSVTVPHSFAPTPFVFPHRYTRSFVEARKFVQVACGTSHSVAITANGEVWTWGSGAEYQLGRRARVIYAEDDNDAEDGDNDKRDGSKTKAKVELGSRPAPVLDLEGKRIVSVECGPTTTYAITDDGKLYTWGSSDDGLLCVSIVLEGSKKLAKVTELGRPTMVDSIARRHIIQVSAGLQHVLLLDDQGMIYSCGCPDYGRLGHKDTRARFVPELVQALSHIPCREIAAGARHSLALSTTGALYRWGKEGQRSSGTSTPQSIARFDGMGLSGIAAGDGISYAFTSTGQVWFWGQARRVEMIGMGPDASLSVQEPQLLKSLKSKHVVGMAASDRFCVTIVDGRKSSSESCDACDEGGALLLCDTCPSAFHYDCLPECIEVADLPEGDWSCPRCLTVQGHQPALPPTASNDCFSHISAFASGTNPRTFSPCILVESSSILGLPRDVQMFNIAFSQAWSRVQSAADGQIAGVANPYALAFEASDVKQQREKIAHALLREKQQRDATTAAREAAYATENKRRARLAEKKQKALADIPAAHRQLEAEKLKSLSQFQIAQWNEVTRYHELQSRLMHLQLEQLKVEQMLKINSYKLFYQAVGIDTIVGAKPFTVYSGASGYDVFSYLRKCSYTFQEISRVKV